VQEPGRDERTADRQKNVEFRDVVIDNWPRLFAVAMKVRFVDIFFCFARPRAAAPADPARTMRLLLGCWLPANPRP